MDDDIAAMLPAPPPAAPARRHAAIAMAMRHFDGVSEPDALQSSTPRGEAPTPWWTQFGRAQSRALASVALVALFGLPLAWMSLDRNPDSRPQAAGGRSSEPETTAALTPADVLADARVPALAKRNAAPLPAASEPAEPVELAQAEETAPPPLATIVARTAEAPTSSRTGGPVSFAARAPREVIVGGSRVGSAPSDMARPPAPMTDAYADAGAGSGIVVTGARVGAADRRGDWNACTVDDPARRLNNCRRVIDPAARGVDGRVATQIADGLTHAWNGDLDAAIAAFDRAVAIAPRSASAYLNRGIAYRRKGQLDAALADLDRAVRHAPDLARGYYQRSLVYRARNEQRRAQADEARARQLEPRYSDVVPG